MKLIHKKDMAIEALKPANAISTRTVEWPRTPETATWLGRPGTVQALTQDHAEDGCDYPISGDAITTAKEQK